MTGGIGLPSRRQEKLSTPFSDPTKNKYIPKLLNYYGIWIGSVVGSTTKAPRRPSARMARKTTCPASLMAGPSVEERPENRSNVPLSRGKSPVRASAVRRDTPALSDMNQKQTRPHHLSPCSTRRRTHQRCIPRCSRATLTNSLLSSRNQAWPRSTVSRASSST